MNAVAWHTYNTITSRSGKLIIMLILLGLFMAKCGHDNYDDWMNN